MTVRRTLLLLVVTLIAVPLIVGAINISQAESTAGDDWGFITRVISLLPSPGKDAPHHLLVIDAVEGLEMLTGDTDAFGQLRSRRSRIVPVTLQP